LKEYDVVVWIDGTIEIETPLVSFWVLNKILNQKMPIVAFNHEFHRGKLWVEAFNTNKMGMYIIVIIKWY
jgi:hypothetical protein